MMNGPAALHSFKPHFPLYQGPQNELVEWIVNKHLEVMALEGMPDQERVGKVLKRFAVNESQIERRYFETDREEIYALTSQRPAGADISKRHEFFGKRALEIFQELYRQDEVPQHLVHVTCTGYLSPSAPQIYFSSLPEAPDITHAYHMGCYASLPAVRMARAFSLGQQQKVDVVHTEICSLHLNPSLHTPEQMVVQTLFADGHIKYCVDQTATGRRFEITAIKEKIVPDSSKDMTWVPGASGMQMTLSKEVPEKIRDHLSDFIRELAQENGLKVQQLIESSLFAIHPGGPKIIEGIEKRLELKPHQTLACRKVLKERGNMSSATLPHVWHDILATDYCGPVVSLAFGPGLTIFGGLFEAKK